MLTGSFYYCSGRATYPVETFFFLYNNISILTCGVVMFFRAGVLLGARATENTLSIIPFVLLFIHVMYKLISVSTVVT